VEVHPWEGGMQKNRTLSTEEASGGVTADRDVAQRAIPVGGTREAQEVSLGRVAGVGGGAEHERPVRGKTAKTEKPGKNFIGHSQAV